MKPIFSSVVTVFILTSKLPLLSVPVYDVFSKSAGLTKRILTILTHEVVDVAQHVISENGLRRVLLLAVGTLVHDVVQDETAPVRCLPPMVVQELVFGTKQGPTSGTCKLAEVGVGLGVDQHLVDVA